MEDTGLLIEDTVDLEYTPIDQCIYYKDKEWSGADITYQWALQQLCDKQWVRLGQLSCAMCLRPVDSPDQLGYGLCEECRSNGAAPIRPYFSILKPLTHLNMPLEIVRCQACYPTMIPPGHYVCCHNCFAHLCLTCYVECVEEPVPYCPCCDQRLLVHPIPLYYFFFNRREKMGLMQYFPESRRWIATQLNENPEMREHNRRFNQYHWLYDKMQQSIRYFRYCDENIDFIDIYPQIYK